MITMTEEDLNLCWDTNTIEAWGNMYFDNVIFSNNIVGLETYLVKGKGSEEKHYEGFECRKMHKGNKTETTYFLMSKDLHKIPIMLDTNNGLTKLHYRQKVWNIITGGTSLEIEPQRILTWREIIDYSGIPYHTKPKDWTRYKLKRLYARITGQLYQRAISESGFGKDKYVESYNLLIQKGCNISDPSRAKIFYSACHNKEITINELGVPTGQEQYEYFNMMMRIGDETKILDNSKRATDGTKEKITLSKLSVSFTHNIKEYYHKKDKKCFEQLYPYNVINRYYPNKYEGYSQRQMKPRNVTHHELALKYDSFIKSWVKSVLWYEKNFENLPNRYPNIPLTDFVFKTKEDRFRTHFERFAHCVSHYAKDEKEYLEILKDDYENNRAYMVSIETDDEHNKNITEESI